MTEHKPWETCQGGIWIRPVGKFNIIADVRWGYEVSHDDAKNTATRIVRAVNSHDQLVAALEHTLKVSLGYANEARADIEYCENWPWVKNARAALAAAEGEKGS